MVEAMDSEKWTPRRIVDALVAELMSLEGIRLVETLTDTEPGMCDTWVRVFPGSGLGKVIRLVMKVDFDKGEADRFDKAFREHGSGEVEAVCDTIL